MEISGLLGYGAVMKYYCTKCERDVDFCPHKATWELDAMRIRAEQFRKFAEYWEIQYNKLREKVRVLGCEEAEKK